MPSYIKTEYFITYVAFGGNISLKFDVIDVILLLGVDVTPTEHISVRIAVKVGVLQLLLLSVGFRQPNSEQILRRMIFIMMVIVMMMMATCRGLDDVLVMVDDPVTEVGNFLAYLRDRFGLVTLCPAGVVRSGQILIGRTLRSFQGPVLLVQGQTKPRYEHSRLLGRGLLTSIMVGLPKANG